MPSRLIPGERVVYARLHAQASDDAAWRAAVPEPTDELDAFEAPRKERFDAHAAKGEKRWIRYKRPSHDRATWVGRIPEEMWLTDAQAVKTYASAIGDDSNLAYDLVKESDVWWYGQTAADRARHRMRLARWAVPDKMRKLSFEQQIALIDSVKTPDDEYGVCTTNPDRKYIWYWSEVSDETMAKLDALLGHARLP